MWYYIVICFIIIGELLLARLNSTYLPYLLLKRHIDVKDKTWQKILIGQSDFDTRRDIETAYKGKMTIHGICLYILWFLVLLFSVSFWIWGPATPIDPIEFGNVVTCTTLCNGIVLMANLTFCGFEFAIFSLNIVRCDSVKANRLVTVLWWIVVIVVWAISSCALIETIKML